MNDLFFCIVSLICHNMSSCGNCIQICNDGTVVDILHHHPECVVGADDHDDMNQHWTNPDALTSHQDNPGHAYSVINLHYTINKILKFQNLKLDFVILNHILLFCIIVKLLLKAACELYRQKCNDNCFSSTATDRVFLCECSACGYCWW